MIPDIVPVNTWAGNDSAKIFDFDFLINSESELKVLHTNTIGYQSELKLNIDYSINQIGNKNGSYISFPLEGSEYSVLKTGENITLMLDIPIAQTMPFGSSAVLNLNSLEVALDYIVRLIQIVDRKTERSVKVQEGSKILPEEIIANIEESENNALVSSNIAFQKATEASNSANLSEEWATKLEGTIDGENYSSKHYAMLASDTVNGALADIEDSRVAAIESIDDKKDDSIVEVNNQESTSINAVIAESNIQKAQLQTYVDKVKNSEQLAKDWATKIDGRVDGINYSAKYYAELAKNNSDINYEQLRTSTAYLNDGNVLSDVEGFNDVQNYYHSTFDLSKFEVVGSPTITDDGVVSGFSANNYLLGSANFDISNTDSWELNGEFTTGADIATAQYPFSLYDVDGDYSIGICIQNSKYYFSISDSEGVLVNAASANPPIIANTKYFYKITYNSAEGYKCYLSQNTENLSLIASSTNTRKINYGDTNIRIGRTGDFSPRPFLGSIDLKQFSITVDGKEVFNGNKTDLDVIKPDNYTVVGSPVITDDGVASNINANNYITFTKNITFSNNIEFYFNGSTDTLVGATVGENPLLTLLNDNNVEIALFEIRPSGTNQDVPNFFIALKDADGTSIFANYIATNLIWEENVLYYFRFKFDGEKYTVARKTINTDYEVFYTINSTTQLGTVSKGYIGRRYDNTAYNKGSIDLNTFKIYVDGNLVYQPCLKIPYTISKTGSKIVDVAYRDRVQDVFEQYGQADYYTIDEENKNFTLPMGEIYGMISNLQEVKADIDLKNITIDSGLRRLIETSTPSNMPSWYKVYEEVNTLTGEKYRWCEQGGKVVGFNTVTFLKSYSVEPQVFAQVITAENCVSAAINNVTTTSFYISDATHGGNHEDRPNLYNYWYAKGYIN